MVPTIMRPAALDRLLAVLVVALAATGAVSLRLGAETDGWLFVVHDLLAGALGVAVAMKLRRSVPAAARARRWGRFAVALLVSLVAVAALSGGWLWVASGELLWVDAGALGRWTVLTIHAWAGLALVPILLVHLLPRRWRLLRPGPATVVSAGRRLVSRRSALAGGLLVAGAVGMTAITAAMERLVGGTRRFTGSRWLPAGGIPPATTFFGEPAPPIDLASWRLRVTGAGGRTAELDLAGLGKLGEVEARAVLDCTSGWAIETTWRGVSLARVADLVAGPSGDGRTAAVVVRSITGWAASVPAPELDRAVLAWSVADGPLAAANGAPLRLVLPGHRGLEWVKWVATVEVG